MNRLPQLLRWLFAHRPRPKGPMCPYTCVHPAEFAENLNHHHLPAREIAVWCVLCGTYWTTHASWRNGAPGLPPPNAIGSHGKRPAPGLVR